MSQRALVKTRARIRAQKVHSVSVIRSNKHFSAQLRSPEGIVLTGMSTQSPGFKTKSKNNGNAEAAGDLGKLFAKALVKLKLDAVAFDRSGYRYHGRVKAFAEALREAGIIQ